MFITESQIQDSSRSPPSGDGVNADWIEAGGLGFDGGSREDDFPSPNLMFGNYEGNVGFQGAMGDLAVPRHGSRSRNVPARFNAQNTLPGHLINFEKLL